MNICQGDKVLIIAGKDKGKTGAVARVSAADHQVIVEGLNLIKRHVKPNRSHPSGGIVEQPAPLDWSNVRLLEATESKPKKVKSTAKDK